MFKELAIAIRNTLILWLITAILYPLIILAIGQTVFPFQANGSFITNNQGEVVGSALIGQMFTSERYFLPRPSSVDYSPIQLGLKTGISGASNLAPSNPQLLENVQNRISQLQKDQITPTADLIYASGSGLDPHISIAAANAQILRVANVRGLSPDRVETLVQQNTEHRFLGIFGEPGVNVLKLNLALDNLS
jgi:potassium-transporting ATPase KdpC subunit